MIDDTKTNVPTTTCSTLATRWTARRDGGFRDIGISTWSRNPSLFRRVKRRVLRVMEFNDYRLLSALCLISTAIYKQRFYRSIPPSKRYRTKRAFLKLRATRATFDLYSAVFLIQQGRSKRWRYQYAHVGKGYLKGVVDGYYDSSKVLYLRHAEEDSKTPGPMRLSTRSSTAIRCASYGRLVFRR